MPSESHKFFLHLNPLTLETDKHLISPNSITHASHSKVTRINENDHKLNILLINKQILLLSTLGNV